jgi:hypothetical protein
LENVEANFVIGCKKIEDGVEGVDGKARTMDGRRGDRFTEIFAHLRKKDVDTRRLQDQVDEKIIRSSELLLGRGIQSHRGRDELFEHIVLFVLLQEVTHWSIQIVAKLLREIRKGSIDENMLGYGRHVVKSSLTQWGKSATGLLELARSWSVFCAIVCGAAASAGQFSCIGRSWVDSPSIRNFSKILKTYFGKDIQNNYFCHLNRA